MLGLSIYKILTASFYTGADFAFFYILSIIPPSPPTTVQFQFQQLVYANSTYTERNGVPCSLLNYCCFVCLWYYQEKVKLVG